MPGFVSESCVYVLKYCDTFLRYVQTLHASQKKFKLMGEKKEENKVYSTSENNVSIIE